MLNFKEYLIEAAGVDTHEILTAALILNGKSITNIATTKEADKLLDKLYKIANGKKLIGAKDTEIEAIQNKDATNYNNLAAACSASNSILTRMSGITAVYMTGQSWHKNIKGFQFNKGTIKDYNSSDIVVQASKQFLGVSLKKKARAAAADPTLINNAVNKFFSGMIPPEVVDEIENRRIKFVTNLVADQFGGKKNADFKQVLQTIKDNLANDKPGTRAKIAQYLTSPKNTYFKFIAKVLEDNKEEFSENFLKTIFRVELKNLQKAHFDFGLCLGIGDFNKSGFRIGAASYEDITRTTEVLDMIFQNMNALSVSTTPGKKQAWEQEATAAKIFYSIFFNGSNIIDIEIRYKGSITANPQFFATATVNFKNLFEI